MSRASRCIPQSLDTARICVYSERMKRKKQINTDPTTYAALVALAAGLGYLQQGGPRSGEGSPVKLLEAIARGGEVVLHKVAPPPRTGQTNEAC